MSPATSGPATAVDHQSPLLALPDEILQHVLTFVSAIDLSALAQTCRRLHVQSNDDRIWKPLVQQNVWQSIVSPTSFATFRELYISHHPHWFLTRNRIWFADSEPSGKLIVTRFNDDTGTIEAHTVVGQMSANAQLYFWEKNPEVVIHGFEPKISLDLHQPVLKLEVPSRKTGDQSTSEPTDKGHDIASKYGREIMMDTFTEPGVFSSFMLCRALPEIAVSEGTRVWPPLRFPSVTRTRNLTGDGYKSTGHRPARLEDISESNFRIRKWAEYTGRRNRPNFLTRDGLRAVFRVESTALTAPTVVPNGLSYRPSETITTYATIPPSAYMPTPQKPWQGIWTGDYSGHGCEFLLLRQPDERDEKPLPANMEWLKRWFNSNRRGSSVSDASSSDVGFSDAARQRAAREILRHMLAAEDPTGGETLPIFSPVEISAHEETDYAEVPTGRLEAIKLTGDPNIPRGEYTFIAPDIGHGGFLRVADEKEFKGARVVRAAGHVAARGFREDEYIPSQLIMISPNRLAQFWETFGHISFYERVDLDALMGDDAANV